ncbi:MAG: hypothetical protein ACM3PR_06715, partial [Bacteroidales bacterium]
KHRLRGKSSILSKAAQLIHAVMVNGQDVLPSSVFQPLIRMNIGYLLFFYFTTKIHQSNLR